MAIRYDVEVERTVTVTATPQPGNSRHAVAKERSGWPWVIVVVGLIVLVVIVGNAIASMVEEWRYTSRSTEHEFKNPLSDFGNAPDSAKPPPEKSKATKAKPKTRPVERTDVEPAQREPENKYNYGGWNSTWCTGTPNLPPVPSACEWAVRSQRR
jgi:hypothetical protein